MLKPIKLIRRAVTTTPPRWLIWLLRLALILAILLLWEWQAHQPKAFAIVPLAKVLLALAVAIQSGDLFGLAAGTLSTVAVGYLAAVVTGCVLGLLIAQFRWAENTLDPLVKALSATPQSVFIPIVAIYFGLGVSGRVFIIFIWSVFPIIESAIAGIKQTPDSLLEMASAFNAPYAQRLWTVVIPSALPTLLVGLRVALGLAFRSAIVAEVLLSSANLGYFIVNANSLFDFPRLTAGVLFIAFLGTFILRGAEWIEMMILRRLKH